MRTFPNSQKRLLIFVGILAFIVGIGAGYLLKAQTSNLAMPSQQAVTQSEPTVPSQNNLRTHPWQILEVGGNVHIMSDSYTGFLISLWEWNGQRFVRPADYTFYAAPTKIAQAYIFEFRHVDSSKTYAIEAYGYRKPDGKEQRLKITRCYGQIQPEKYALGDIKDMCIVKATTDPEKGVFFLAP